MNYRHWRSCSVGNHCPTVNYNGSAVNDQGCHAGNVQGHVNHQCPVNHLEVMSVIIKILCQDGILVQGAFGILKKTEDGVEFQVCLN